MEMTGFFDYPGGSDGSGGSGDDADEDQPFLSNCSTDEWDLIAAHADRLRFEDGDVVIDQGSVERALVVVVSGQLEVLRDAGRGRRKRRVSLLGVGAVVGELAFLDGRPASALVRSVGQASILRLTLARFEVLAAKDPQLGLYVLFDLGRVVSTRLRGAQAALGANLR